MPVKDIWFWTKSARLYEPTIKRSHKGQTDEGLVYNYLAAKGLVKVVSLGIGTGRETAWLKNLKNATEIIGVDYSDQMLAECQKNAAKNGLNVVLIQDDLFSLKKLAEKIQYDRSPFMYVCFLNTLGNFSGAKRRQMLVNIRKLMKKPDRLILCLYKKPWTLRSAIALPPQIIIKDRGRDDGRVSLALEYARNEVLWSGIYERYGNIPRFNYETGTDDAAAYSGVKRIFFSHRFSKKEIEGMCRFTDLKIEKIIEGGYIWVAILKI